MKFTDSLKLNYEFRRLYAKGSCARASSMAVYCRKRKAQGNRLGITVSTKIGKAVVRNKIRRRLREIYRINEDKLLKGYDIVIVARSRSAYMQFRELEQDFLRLAQKLKMRSDVE